MIKGADKGGAVVIQNRDDYIKEGIRQLSDNTFYKHTDKDLTEYHNSEVNKVIWRLRLNGEISASVESKLITGETKTPEIYFLPKIHKDISPPPGRPIVSANGCPTEKNICISRYLPKTLLTQSKIISQRHHTLP